MTSLDKSSNIVSETTPTKEISDPAVLSKTPLVSVEMLTYNHEHYIAQAIEGVLLQKADFSIELVIGEDCSTDRTREIIFEYQKKYPEIIRVITSEQNVGALKNSRRAHNACRGKYIAFCEGDDYWHYSLKLLQQVDYLESHPDVGLIHSDVDCHFVRNGITAMNRFRNHPMTKLSRGGIPLIENLITGKYIVMTCSVMTSKDLLDEIFTDCTYEFSKKFLMGDIQIWCEIAHRSKFAYIDEAFATYRVLTESASNSENPDKVRRFLKSGTEIRLHYAQKYGSENLQHLRATILKDYIGSILRLSFRYRRPDLAKEVFCLAKKEQLDIDLLDAMYLHASKNPFFFCLMYAIRGVRKIGGKVFGVSRILFLKRILKKRPDSDRVDIVATGQKRNT